MGKIQINPELMKQLEQELEKQADSVKAIAGRLRYEFNGLREVYPEIESTYAGELFYLLQREMNYYQQTITEASNTVEKTVHEFEQADAVALALAMGETPLEQWNRQNGSLGNDGFSIGDVLSGIWDGAGKAVGNTVDGIVQLVTHPLDTLEGLGNAIAHPVDTASLMWNALETSWQRDVINGDAHSRSQWFSYALTQVGIGLIGTKGADKIAKLSKGARFPMSPLGRQAGLQPAYASGSKIPYNVFNTKSFKDHLYKAVSYTYDDGNKNKTIKLRMGHLQGDKHPVTGVPYDRDGFPIFDSKYETHLHPADYKKSRQIHDKRCNEKLLQDLKANPHLKDEIGLTDEEIEDLEFSGELENYTWHHHQEPGKMQLVDSNIHSKTGHTGGYKIWGKGK
ncbi:HNH endonuclease [Aneurinibacillus tyrosinisolvens]|uniref:HNH endonuclease n=1 Tax=Aneurinibacillus tyrosinisolvens TaxID=1443435 RepID=UPI00069ACA0C|nr:HNH endonuclease [Aneurinibacillus tyrosinisolvens]